MFKFLFLFVSFFISPQLSLASCAGQEKVRVGINQFVKHPALDRTVEGIVFGLAQEGYKLGDSFELQIELAQANPCLAAQISQKFASQGFDVAVGVGTIAAQTLNRFALNGQLHVVFSSVSFPVKSGLIPSLTKPGPRMTGVSNFVPIEQQIKLFQTLQPMLKRLGFLYNAGENNSVQFAAKIKEICAKVGLEFISQTVTKTADVAQNTARLAQRVDAIFISNDNTALSSMPTIVRVATQRKIPVYVSDTDAVSQGALAALGPNQFAVGEQTGRQVAKILKQKQALSQGKGDVMQIPVLFPDVVELVVNSEMLEILGLALPDELKRKARMLSRSQVSR